MARTETFWDNLRGAFDSREILVGQRQSLYCERDASPIHEMRQIYRQGGHYTKPPIGFLSGHRGAGKSSLLFQWMQAFQNDFLLIYCDVEHNLESSKANHLDLLLLLGTAIYNAAQQEGVKPDSQNLLELGKALDTITKKGEEKPTQSVDWVKMAQGVLTITNSLIGSKVSEKLIEYAFKPFSITSGVSEETARKREIEPNVQEVINNVNLIIADVETKAGKPLLVIVDGLDKIQRQEQANLIFLQSRALQGVRCRLLYTVPMLIAAQPAFSQATQECRRFLLPNIHLYSRLEGHPRDEAGYGFMREVIAKRLATVGLTAEALFEPKVQDLLIEKSGGVLRWLILLVHNACLKAEQLQEEKISLKAAQETIADRVVEMTGQLTVESREILRTVRKEDLPSSNPLCSELLHALFIVAYRNGETWYDAHPLLWEALGP